ncbi:carboxyl transferase domain-containing protein [Candidatus Poriferisodalis sp.]|uniref:carboxyl transferase domain-containing protein n=1 Tax=Candidatus Poriferisodalis sp. TaxID=3101277 RepID=UPI003B01D37E
MGLKKLLIANRGEIAVRVARAASELGIGTVAIAGDDDTASLHTRVADESVTLEGRGVAAYLDVDGVVDAAVSAGCDAIHPGYGFLAENPALALACKAVGIVFVGPTALQLELFGDKLAARALAQQHDVPLLPATSEPTSAEAAQAFFAEHGPIMIKALAGGGGRGMRAVRSAGELEAAYERCASEAAAAFGNGDLYVEQLIERARHIEVQIIGDGEAVAHLGERECTLQRQNQKIVEIAPSPTLRPEAREAVCGAAVEMARAVRYRSLGTWEFLIDADDPDAIAFCEVNARIQVEHTVTEEVTGVDLVAAQLRIAGDARLADVGLAQRDVPAPRGYAIQCRINTESMQPDGTARPSGGVLSAFEPPTGPGIRTDTYGYVGYGTNPSFDSLLAKVIACSLSPDYADAVRRARRALGEFRIDGVATNLEFQAALLDRPEVIANDLTTSFLTEHADELCTAATSAATLWAPTQPPTQTGAAGRAGAVVGGDPLAVLRHGDIDDAPADRAASDAVRAQAMSAGTASLHSAPAGAWQRSVPVATVAGPDGSIAVAAPLQGTIVSLAVSDGDPVAEGQQVAVMEAMKMEHVVTSTVTGIVRMLGVSPGDTVYEGHSLLFVEEAEVDVELVEATAAVDLDCIRPDLAEVFERRGFGLDENRPEAVAKRHGRGHRTARENLTDLVDAGTFVEYSPLMVAAQRRRRSMDDLIANTQGDGMVAGVASVNGELFGPERSMAMVMSYDYMVLAGTQGGNNHRKKDRMFEIAEHNRLPVVLLAEGGGGRPGDTDGIGGSGLDCWAFTFFAQLSGLVPLVGVTNGRCFAGNAVLLGCCDVIIATEGSNIGVGGPAMIEGGGLGVFRPEEVGPVDVQWPNGVIDVLVADEAEAIVAAKQYLSYFQGDVDEWECHDQRELRHLIPENRLRAYDVREIIDKLCDVGSVMELRRGWGPGCVTALARIEGSPIGVVANNNHHLGGAVDADAGDKAARFIQLCDAHDIPLLFLCDTPGIMVGPQAEYEATVRHAARMFVTAANVTVPFMTIVLRKGYGLGAQAMAGGSFKAPTFTVSWPTGEFGGMGLEGFVKLGYRRELEAIEDPEERIAEYEKRVARLYEQGKAVNTATFFEIDDVIDPAESRDWVRMALLAAPKPPPRTGKKRPMVDTW